MTDKNPRSVAVVGAATMSRIYDPEEWDEVWGLNSLHEVTPRWDRWFELHGPDYVRTLPHHSWLAKSHGKPIYMQREAEEIKDSVAFPLAEVNAWMVRYGALAYFTSSFSYMVAFALSLGVKKLGIFGCEFMEDHEWYFERAGIEFLIGIARGSGVEVVIPPESSLLRIAYMYGYEEPRLNLSDVEPVCLFLDQEIAKLGRAIERTDAAIKESRSAEGAKLSQYLDRDYLAGQRSGLRSARTWMRHYARGGTLLARDGTVTSDVAPAAEGK